MVKEELVNFTAKEIIARCEALEENILSCLNGASYTLSNLETSPHKGNDYVLAVREKLQRKARQWGKIKPKRLVDRDFL